MEVGFLMKAHISALALVCLALFTGCGGGSSTPIQTPPPQAATINGISPSSVEAGAAAVTLQVTGTSFVSGSEVTFNGANLATTFGSATSLSATIPASSLTGGQTAQVAVNNPGAAASGTVAFLVNSPTPTLISATPSAVAEGRSASVTLTGTGFESNSAVQLNGVAVNSTFVNSTTLTANFTAANLGQAGSGQLTVVNPAPQGGASPAIALEITQPIPVLQSISPASILAGAGAVTVTITGSSFTATAEVTANGSPVTLSSQTPTSISFPLTAASDAQTGSISLIVTNPGVNPESSGAQTIAVVTTPTVSLLYPSGAALGSPDQTINVYGTNFSPVSVVEWNGAALSTTYQSSSQLMAVVPAIDIARFNNASIIVSTPIGYPASPGFAASTSLPFSTYLSLPNNDIAYNPVDGLVYASVPGSGPGNLGNCIVGFDPIDGNIVKTIPVGSEPGRIAISDDGTQLFAGLNGAAAVRQVNLATATAGVQFSLGPATVVGTPTTVEAIAALPGEPNSVAVFDNDATVTIFDSGVARANTSFGITNGYLYESNGSLSFGASASTLYASSYLGGLYALSVDATGVTAGKALSTNIIGGFQVQYDNGRLYLSNGTVLDAGTANQLGEFFAATNQVATGPVVSDSTLGLAFVAGSNFSSAPQLAAFSESTFNPAGSIPVSNAGFQKIVRWGQNGLAASNPTQIYVVQSPIVKDLSSSPADLAVTISAPSTATTGSAMTWTARLVNNGPGKAQGITFNSSLADSVIVESVTPSQGTCAGGNQVNCNLGSLANGSTATVTITAIPSTAGTVESTAAVSSISFDPAQGNNQSTASITITGGLYSRVPMVTAISPALVQAGSGSFTLTVTGSGFNNNSTVQVNGQSEPTTPVSDTTLTANIDGSAIANYGWAPVTVSSPSPGGGVSQVAPLTIYALVNVPASAIAFDPFTRKIYATLPSASTTYTGNSIVAVDPATGSVGMPIVVGSEPDIMAETSDGNYLYVGLRGAASLGRFNLVTQALDSTIPLNLNQFGYTTVAAGSMAAMPGSDSSLAISTAQSGHLGIFDVSGNSGSFRTSLTGGSNPIFLDAAHLDLLNYGLDQYSVDANGLTAIGNGATGVNLAGFSGLGPQTAVLNGGLLYGVGGGIANPFSTPPSQVATLNVNGLYGLAVAPDAPASTDFLVLENAAGSFWFELFRYNTTQYVAEDALTLPADSNGGELGYDMLRWGQDGIALRAYGDFGNTSFPTQILLIHGPFVLPAELNSHPSPQLTGANPTTIAAKSGNTILTLTGSGFMPGAVALWKGSPRTTSFISETQLSVAIAAGDVATAGSGTITAQNPNSAASGPVTVTVN